MTGILTVFGLKSAENFMPNAMCLHASNECNKRANCAETYAFTQAKNIGNKEREGRERTQLLFQALHSHKHSTSKAL